MPLLGGEHFLPSLEEANLNDLNPPESAEENVTTADCTHDRDTQLLIPRKPVSTGSPVTGKQPLANAQPLDTS